MRSVEEKGCARVREENGGGSSMKKSWASSPHHRSSLGKAAPSKWDDAQKWLVNLSRGDKNEAASPSPSPSPRNSNACLIPKKEKEWGEENKYVTDECAGRGIGICLRDMGTEMTPFGSKEPSRAATPIRATSPCTPAPPIQRTAGESDVPSEIAASVTVKQVESLTKNDDAHSPSQARAAAWEEAERAKYTARYKRQQVRIQAWENHEKNKAEMENRKVEVKAEQMKSRAKEKCMHRRAAIERIAQEKRAVAEAKLNENAINNSEKADYIRRNGRLPFFFSFYSNFPSRCW